MFYLVVHMLIFVYYLFVSFAPGQGAGPGQGPRQAWARARVRARARVQGMPMGSLDCVHIFHFQVTQPRPIEVRGYT